MMRPALLVIDLQHWFLEVGPAEKLARVGRLIANANALIDFFQDRDLPVVRILTVHKADGSTWNQWMKEHDTPRLIEGTPEAEEHPEVHRRNTDVVMRKTRHSAFIRTELEAVLLARAVDTVVVAGFSTNACVGLTTVEAYERDFKIILAGDAILGTSQEEGKLMLDYLRNRFAIEPIANARIMETISGQMGH
ncbi:MAG TPA: cysteine hydrolase [Phycisphaerae bacterium]|nr:cysteine hydrolase [Phycisphaerae bacterium]